MILLRRRILKRCTFSLLVLCILSILSHKARPLFALLSEDGGPDRISARTLFLDPHLRNKTQLIPKIIHQTYKTTSIPLKWQAGQQRLLQHHPDYEYMFWTDASALHFISTHNPSFLLTYTSYPYPIQRVDALRYFILYHYGGIYLDLDVSPYRRLDALLTLPAFACLTTPTGISNDALGATPHHPFLELVIDRLQMFDRNWGSPYVTVMASTGPLFLSLCWREWLDFRRGTGEGNGGEEGRLRVLVPYSWGYGFFVNVEGRSWQGWDEKIVGWLERHWVFDVVMGIAGVVAVMGAIWRLVEWSVRWVGTGGRGWIDAMRWKLEIGWRRVKGKKEESLV